MKCFWRALPNVINIFSLDFIFDQIVTNNASTYSKESVKIKQQVSHSRHILLSFCDNIAIEFDTNKC